MSTPISPLHDAPTYNAWNVTVYTRIRPSHAGSQTMVLVRVRIYFGITHCRSSAYSGVTRPQRTMVPPELTFELAQPDCSTLRDLTREAHPVFNHQRTNRLSCSVPCILASGLLRQEVGNATTRYESRNTGNRTIAPVSILTRVRSPEM